jgi:hypothetical protein
MLNFNRDDCMVLERALQDRIDVLQDKAGSGDLCYNEVQNCVRLRRVLLGEIEPRTKSPIKAVASATI